MSPLLLLAGGYEGQIHTLSFDPSASPPTLAITSSTACGLAPTWLVLSPTSATVFVADEWGAGAGALTSHAISPSGQLARTSATGTGATEVAEWPCHASLLLSTEPARLLVATYRGATLSAIPLLAAGEAFEAADGRQTLSFLGAGTLGPHPRRQDQAHPHAVTVDPTGRFVVVPDLGTDCLWLLRVNSAGDLVRGPSVQLEAGDGPRHVLFRVLTGGQTVLYVLNELSNSVSAFAVAYPSGPVAFPTFAPLQAAVSLLPSRPPAHQSDFATWHAAELKLSRDGRTLIASNRSEGHNPADPPRGAAEDLLALFAVDPASGRLDPASRTLVGSGGCAPRHLSLSSERVGAQDGDAEWVATALHDSDEVVVSELRDGLLTEVVRLKGVGKPACVLFVN